MDSLSRLREALDAVEVVLDSAMNQFRKQEVSKLVVLVKDVIEPRKLGILFTYFKDLRLTNSTGFLKKKQEETERELSILEKRKQRLQICQSSILEEQKHQDFEETRETSNLPKIEEHRPCMPVTKLGKISRDENGLFEISEEKFAYEELRKPDENISKVLHKNAVDQEEMSDVESLPEETKELEHRQRNVEELDKSLPACDQGETKGNIPAMGAKAAVENCSKKKKDVSDTGSLYKGVIDLDVMEKLDSMSPNERAEYTAQFYSELLEEEDWLFSEKCDEEQSTSHGTKHDRKGKTKHRSKLCEFFNKKNVRPRSKKCQDQSVSQNQVQENRSTQRNISKKRPVIMKKNSKGILLKKQMMEQRQPTFLQDAESAPLKSKVVEHKSQLGAAHIRGSEQKTKKLSKFKRRQMNLVE